MEKNRKKIIIGVIAGILLMAGLLVAQATLSDQNEYDLTNLKANNAYSDLYYKAIYLNSTGEMTFTNDFAQPNWIVIIPANDVLINDGYVFTGGIVGALVCCNITIGDRLYTNGGTAALNGTLTNGFNKVIATKQYRFSDTSWQNVNVNTGQNPPLYNRMMASAQGFGGQQIAWATQSMNVSEPTMMLVKLIGN